MEDLIKKENGANFFKADLHTHTPTDRHFTFKDFNPKDRREKFAEIYVNKMIEKGLQIIGITEHNSVEWIDEIRDAAEETKLTIFPGFEISADTGASGVHLICLFDPGTEKNKLDDIITQLGLPREDRFYDDGSCKSCGKTLEEVIQFIKEQDGLPIAAHVTGENGILNKSCLNGEQRINAWTNEELIAGEFPNSRTYYRGEDNFIGRLIRNEQDKYKRDKPMASIYSSDGRSIEEIGSKFTYLKLSDFTIEALRTSFLDYESRIRHPDEYEIKDFSKIVAAKWEGGFLNGFQIHFNSNLNCLIGGKGTGKSTIIETLRYAFDQKPKGEEVTEQHEQIIDEVFKAGSKISVLAEHHTPKPKKYLIERTYKSKPKVYKWNGDEKEKLEGVKPTQIISDIEFYGQKEILELSKDDSIQVDLLKRFQDNDFVAELREEEVRICESLDDNREYIIKYNELKVELKELKSEKSILEDRLESYKEAGILQEFEEKRVYIVEESKITRADKIINDISSKLESFKEGIKFDLNLTDVETSLDFLEEEKEIELPHEEMLKNIEDLIINLKSEINGVVNDLEEKINEVREKLELKKEEWKGDYEDQQERYHIKLQKYQGKAFDPSNIEDEIKQLKQVKDDIEKKSNVSDTLEKSYKKRNMLLEELREVRRRKFLELSKAADKVNEELRGIVKVEVEYEGEKQEFVDKIFDFNTGARKSQLKKITEYSKFTPQEFSKIVLEGEECLIDKYDISEAASESLKDIELSDLLDLQKFDINPSIDIKLNKGSEHEPNYKNTENLSVGERCTAILMIILIHKAYPLIIDQPEDDLDNEFVTTEIVPKIRQQKGKRQCIIATHDANIPVLGDSELIQVLFAEYDKIEIDKCKGGSIDNKKLREPVENILEGGKAAFMERKRKYGYE